MKTQIYDKTTMVWGISHVSSLKTNIPVDDWHDKKDKHFHTIEDLRIISCFNERQDNRQALIKISLFRVSIGPTTKRQEIIARLENLDESVIKVIDNEFTKPFEISYYLRNGESFCDSAINKAELIFKTFGVEDKKQYNLCNFSPIRETLVKTRRDGFIPYGDYLRKKHGLPQLCSLQTETIRLDGGLTIRMEYQESESNWLYRLSH